MLYSRKALASEQQQKLIKQTEYCVISSNPGLAGDFPDLFSQRKIYLPQRALEVEKLLAELQQAGLDRASLIYTTVGPLVLMLEKAYPQIIGKERIIKGNRLGAALHLRTLNLRKLK